jgi:hypothetical protein|tara:strand:+ start:749 stop:913 length:165 start_codon:yes stop_codon:yes gene_type:complete
MDEIKDINKHLNYKDKKIIRDIIEKLLVELVQPSCKISRIQYSINVLYSKNKNN